MNKIKSIKVLIMAFFMLAALAIPVSASTEEDILHLDESGGSTAADKSGNHNDWIPGYGIVARTISLTVDPEKIPANGISTSMITAQLKDKKGNDVNVKM